tara:strand:- start:438 stop:851 length:414 start_codon:yes stop_codon:yes gene_type:complete
MKSMHLGDERPLRIRAVTETAVIAEPVEEEIFNPEAAKTDGNPFPDQLQETDYDSMTVEELKALLRARGLPVTGTKAELIARLIEADTPSEEAVEVEEVAPSEEAATSEEETVSDENDHENDSGLDEPVGEQSSDGA